MIDCAPGRGDVLDLPPGEAESIIDAEYARAYTPGDPPLHPFDDQPERIVDAAPSRVEPPAGEPPTEEASDVPPEIRDMTPGETADDPPPTPNKPATKAKTATKAGGTPRRTPAASK